MYLMPPPTSEVVLCIFLSKVAQNFSSLLDVNRTAALITNHLIAYLLTI